MNMNNKLKITFGIVALLILIILALLGLDTVVGILLALGGVGAIILLTVKWGGKFWYILFGGFIVYVMSADPGVGLGLAFIIVMSYLACKFGDFKKK